MKTSLAISVLLLALCPHGRAAQETASGREDWTSISIAQTPMKSAPALVAERDDYPTFTREMIELRWRPGDPIHLFLVLPKGKPKPPVILYLYSYPSGTDRFLDDDFCKFLAQDGFAAAGFVSALTGQRYHNRPMKQWFISQLQESLGSSVHDVQMLLNYLAGRGDVDITHAGMFGAGSGAAIAILAAAADPRIKALDLVDPWGDWPIWLAKSTLVPDEERADYLKPEFLKKVAPLDPVQWFGKVTVPVRLQSLNERLVTPALVREHIAAAAPPQTKVISYKDAMAQYKAAQAKFFDWIKDQLRPRESASKPPAA
jgi:cephalosporin-C deacetylase-like acetyl esterase